MEVDLRTLIVVISGLCLVVYIILEKAIKPRYRIVKRGINYWPQRRVFILWGAIHYVGKLSFTDTRSYPSIYSCGTEEEAKQRIKEYEAERSGKGQTITYVKFED